MKNKKTKLFAAFMMLIITLTVFSTASYAWFTENSLVSLSNLTVNVATSDGIQISTDATNWKATLTSADIAASTLDGGNPLYGRYNQVPYVSEDDLQSVKPVSTGGSVTNGRLRMYLGTVASNETGEYLLTSAQLTDTPGNVGHYYAFDVYVLASKLTVLYLTGSSVISDGENGIENATRVAFINEGVVPSGSEVSTAYNLWNGSTVMIWEPNAGSHTASAISHAKNSYGITLGATQVIGNYYGISSVFEQASITTNAGMSIVYPTMQSVGETVTSSDTSLSITVNEGINKIRIYAWIEGQDYDCQDFASGSNVTFNIIFAKRQN